MSQTELVFRERRKPVESHIPDVAKQALERAWEGIPVGHTLTAESLRDRLSSPVLEVLRVTPNAIGGWLQQKARAHLIVHEGFCEAQRDAARGRPIRRWRKIAA